MRWIETDTGTNVDISSATAIGVYTANADRLIICDVSVDAVAGAGDYVMYITRQIGGSGSAYVVLPKTTMAAASGETAISGQSGFITVRNGDVLTCYVDGLAGDTSTPDWTTRWYELAALKPATADRTIDVDASGQVIVASIANNAITAAAIAQDAIDADAIKADAVTEIGTGVWASATRTLTQSAASVAAVMEGSSITIRRGDTVTVSLTGLGDLSTYTKIWLTFKDRLGRTDAQSILQIEKTGGLLYLNGVAHGTAADAAMTIADEATGAINILIKAVATAELIPHSGTYDVQGMTSGSVVNTLAEGTYLVEGDVTRAVA